MQDAVEKIVKNAASTMGQRGQKLQSLVNDARLANFAKSVGISVEALQKIQSGTLTKEDLANAETTYNVSTNGKTVYQGEVVAVKEVTSVKDGKMTLRLENGTEVDSRALSYGTEAEALVYEVVAGMGVDVKTANILLDSFHIQEGSSMEAAKDFAHGVSTAFRYGMYNYSMDELSDTDAAKLSKGVRELVYGQGQKVAGKQVAKEQAKAKEGKNPKVAKKHGSEMEGYSNVRAEGDVQRITEKREAELKFMDFVAREFAGGAPVYVYESYYDKQKGYRVYKDSNGVVRRAPNGKYRVGGEIWVDLNAGMKGEGFMLNTFAHELTHFIFEQSPAKAKKLANFLVEQYGKSGQSVEELVRARMKKSGLSYAEAFEEVVADSMERMFVDGDVMSKLLELKKQDSGLFNMIKQFIDKWVSKLRKYYGKDGIYVTTIGKQASELEQFEKLQQLFAEALVDAGENYQKAQKNTTDAGGVKYSLNSNAKGELHKALYDKTYQGELLLRDESPAIILAQKGVKNLPMTMKVSHIRENVFTETEAKKLGLRVDKNINYHGLGEDFFLQIIDGLDNVKEAYRGTKNAENPVRGENYFLLVSEFLDKDGNVINVPVYIDEHLLVNKVFIDVNKISTSFGRNDFREYIGRQIRQKNLVRIKNRSNQTSESNAPIARDYGKDASKSSIRNSDENVNTETEKTEEKKSERDIDLFDITSYPKIKMSRAEWRRFESEAMTWNADKVGKVLYQTLANGFTYVYTFNEDYSLTVFNKYKATNIYERQGVIDDKRNREKSDRSNGESRSGRRDDTPGMLSPDGGEAKRSDTPAEEAQSEVWQGNTRGYAEDAFDVDETRIKRSERDNDSISNRSLLANALETLASDDKERSRIAEYKASLEAMEAEEAKLRELNAQIKELSFAKGKRDTAKIRKLRDEKIKTTNRIAIYDKQLLRLEAAKPLQKVLERERKRAYDRAKQKNKEAMAEYKKSVDEKFDAITQQYREQRKEAVAKVRETSAKRDVRQKILKFKKRMEQRLLRPTDTQYVPAGLAKAMVEVCELINTDTDLYKADGVAGAKFTAAVKAFQKANSCRADGVITAKNKTWKILLGMR